MTKWLCFDRLLPLGLAAILPMMPPNAPAQTAASDIVAGEAAAPPGLLWTPRRLLNATPDDPSPAAGFVPAPLDAAPTAAAKSQGEPGQPPTVSIAPQPDDLVNAPIDLDSPTPSGAVPNLSLGFGPFTESRVIPPNTGQSALAIMAYPYRAVGRLFAHDPRTGQDHFCSAAMIAPRGILTAGHCVAHGSAFSGQRYFFTDFMFVPAYNNGEAPFKKWSSTGYRLVARSWLFSGLVPNPHDFAMIEAADQGGKTLGSVVGWFGAETFRLASNHFTTLGYPCNLDSCMLMQRNDAQTFRSGGNNTWIQGSSMGSGAGGGPWVQDFGLNPKGAPALRLGPNIVVGVTSYTRAGGIGLLGASQFDQTFLDMRARFCAHQTGNCPPR